MDFDEEDGMELIPADEQGEKIVEEADLSWGTVRSAHKEHFCYRKRRGIALWAFSIFMIALITALVSIAVVVIEEHDQVKVNWGYKDLKTEKFITDEIVVPSGQTKMGFFFDIPKPKGDFMMRALTIDLVDEYGKSVQLEQVYNHHLFLGTAVNESLRIIGAVGAEGARIPIRLPKPYGVPCYADQPWVVSFELINQWGMASGADVKLFITYEVSYTLGLQPDHVVNWRLLGLDFAEVNKTFAWDIPGDGGPYSVLRLEQDYDWGPVSGKTVFSWGHVHIGALNNTLYDISDPKQGPQEVCVSTPQYSSTGFINAIERKEKVHTFPKDGKFRIVSYYDNSRNYGKVMSLVATYATANVPTGSDPDSEFRRKEFERRKLAELAVVLHLFKSTISIVPSFFIQPA